MIELLMIPYSQYCLKVEYGVLVDLVVKED